LNTTDLIVDITGRITLDGEIHKKHLGGTGYELDRGRTYGTPWLDETAQSVVETSDGGFAIAGTSSNIDHPELSDVWLVKADVDGNMEWNMTYSGANKEQADSVIQTSDEGFAIGGCTNSYGAGLYDFWLVKTDESGNAEWNRTYGGADYDYLRSFVETIDGGFAIAGQTRSFGAGNIDFWLVKVDSLGNMEWNKTYGGPEGEQLGAIVETSDGYALAGWCIQDGSPPDFWLVKTDSIGNQMWNKTYGGQHSCVRSMVQTGDGGFALVGEAWSANGSVDAWLVKTDINGTMMWNEMYGEANQDDYGSTVVQATDGGYTILLETMPYSGVMDYRLVKTDSLGNKQWAQLIEEDRLGHITSMIKTGEDGYALVGHVNPFFPELQPPIGDFWLVRTDLEGRIMWLRDWFKYGLALTDSTADTVTLYRGAADPYWNYVRIEIWAIKENP